MAEEVEHISVQPNGNNIHDTDDNQENDPEVFLDSSSQFSAEVTPSTSQEVIAQEFQDASNTLITANSSQDTISDVFLDSTSQPDVIITSQNNNMEEFLDASQLNVRLTPNTSQESNSEEFLESEQNEVSPNTSQDTISDDSEDFQDSTSQQDIESSPETSQENLRFQEAIRSLYNINDAELPDMDDMDFMDIRDCEELEREEQNEEDSSIDEDEQHFDITLAATHSYLGPGLVTLGGRVVLEAGWKGLVPVLGHSGPVFPGETVPLCLTRAIDIEHMEQALQGNKLFGLLSPDSSWTRSSGYGSLCEVYEASEPSEDLGVSLNVKARATHRFRLTDRNRQNIRLYDSVMLREVEVLPEVCLGDPLYPARLTSLDPHRGTKSTWIRDMESVMSTWPRFLFDVTDMSRIKKTIYEFFKDKHDKMPEEPISLSFWVASNLPLNKRDGLSLLMVDEALLRLTMEAAIIARINTLCCCSCRSVITKLEYTFAMSSEGLHSNYTNQYGYLHDVITTSHATNVSDGSDSSEEYSWFPGYKWTIVVCATCHSHVGWRFDSLRRNLRPSSFYGISRNYVQPLNTEEDTERRPIIHLGYLDISPAELDL